MSWSWGSNVPAWPQEAVFTLAAGWFFVRAVHGQPAHRRTGGSRWHDLHHAVMAGTLSWSIIAMSSPHPPGGRDAAHLHADTMTMSHHHGTVSRIPDNGPAAVALAVYFIVAAGPWLSTAVRAARRPDGTSEQHTRGHALDAACHAAMSIGMAAMFAAMA
jgi:hypothetical protein